MKLTRLSCSIGIENSGKPAAKLALRHGPIPIDILSPGWGRGGGRRSLMVTPGLDRTALRVLNEYPEENAALRSLDCMCQPFFWSISKYARVCLIFRWLRSGPFEVLVLNVHLCWADWPCWVDSKLSSLFWVSTMPESMYQTWTND